MSNIEDIKLYNGDCLEVMKDIPEKLIDMILCDLPYGTTKCKWDVIIPFDKLWEQYERIIKDNGIILLFASQPFIGKLIFSNINMYKYELIWEKSNSSNFIMAKKQPLRYHENLAVFYKKQPTYNPIMEVGKPNHGMGKKVGDMHINNIRDSSVMTVDNKKDGLKYPKTILKFNSVGRSVLLHPTQKPVDLLEYLIKTYTNVGDTVLDNCMGSGSTGVACVNTNRKFIGIELDNTYFNIAENRIMTA